ncbi:Gfo/Idh/MocA family protein [Horticoccus sp. 23ND18S-11]|uniref:Gfo/Idh/MocA family protein n=1 Tax=Horticoccus sp. 23ND18S-11 TaxID=3391832 RepID=UPI0039C8C59E
MKKYNVAVIGYGWVATAHIQAINATAHAQVAAVFSSRPQDDAALSARHGSAIQSYTDLTAMLKRPDIHAVSICSYPSQHVEHVLAAAKAGKHIILEKPITLSLKDAKAVTAAVAKAKVKTCVCFECRFSSQFQVTKSVIDAGILGTIHYGEVDYYHGIGPWYGQFRWNTAKKDGGSSLLSAGCHAMDALLLCMGGEVEAVTSYSTRSQNKVFAQYEYATTSVTILKFSGGRIGKVASVIDCIQPYYFHTHLVGSEGSLLDNKFHSNQLGGLNKHAWSTLSMKMLDSGDVSDHPYQSQFEAFFAALDRGEDMPLTSLAESIKSHRVVLAADLSAELGREVKLKELK